MGLEDFCKTIFTLSRRVQAGHIILDVCGHIATIIPRLFYTNCRVLLVPVPSKCGKFEFFVLDRDSRDLLCSFTNIKVVVDVVVVHFGPFHQIWKKHDRSLIFPSSSCYSFKSLG